MKNINPEVSPKKKWWRKIVTQCIRALAALLLVIGLFVASSYVRARIPVNRHFQHATDDGVEILLINNGVHVDLVIPLDAPSFRMRPMLEGGTTKPIPIATPMRRSVGEP